ncbi:PepSY-associated TM helix domain-containing protein [Shewanella maritima]|uniref:PepSY-associated TM helix domain-containing protein n=1 Tax=Shewanella maritima TaxID=2520507 RepID=UPI003736D888
MRKSLFKWHAYSALIAMLPLLIISITGSILVFKVEIDSLLRPEHMRVDVPPHTQRQSLDTLMQNVLTKHTGYELGGWELFDDKQRSDAGYLIKHGTDEWSKIYVNQYSGQLLSTPQNMQHYITDWLLELHYSFLWHVKGASIAFVSALMMLFLGISGMLLYRRFWVKLFTMRFNAVKRILFSDIHKFVGITASPILLVVAFTGAYWNISGIIHEVTEHADGEHFHIVAPLHSPDISFEALRVSSAEQIASYRANYLAMPHEPDRDITFYGEVDNKNLFSSEYSSIVKFDKTTGELLEKTDIRDAGMLHVIVDSFRKLHFGYFGGLFTRILWCIMGLMPVILGVTGLYLFWQRQRQQLSAKRNRQQLATS